MIDTNVVASAIFFGGRPRVLLEKLLQREYDAFVTDEILQEYSDTVAWLQSRYPSRKIAVPLTQIAAACRMIEPKTQVHVCRDPDDDMFIGCAVDSGSLYVVSGDRDLLSVGMYRGIEIVTVADFLARLGWE